MARDNRGETTDRIFHVINRGVEKRDIFLSPEDYAFFESQAREVLTSFGISILSYALMPNHFHLLLAVAKNALSRAMRVLESRHSMYFNRVHRRVGHLFQGRFKSFEVANDDYLTWLPVYIHRNPVRAKLAATADKWRWSGHGELLSGGTRNIDLEALRRFGLTPEWFRDHYRRQMTKLGRPLEKHVTLQEILEWSSIVCGINWREVLAGARGAPFSRTKRLVAENALDRGYTLTDTARFLGCTVTALSHLLNDTAEVEGQAC